MALKLLKTVLWVPEFLLLFLLLLFLLLLLLLFLVPEVCFSVSLEGKKTSSNGGQLTDRAAPIGFK